MFEKAMVTEMQTGHVNPPNNEYLHVPVNLIEKATARKLSGRAVSVLLTLAASMNEESRARVSLNTLTARLHVSQPTVISALKKLESAGLIEVIRGRDEDGGVATNIYVLKY